MYWYTLSKLYWYTFKSALETHASPDASLAYPLLFVLHLPSETLVGIVAGATHFELGKLILSKNTFPSGPYANILLAIVSQP
jgi:hypothetical protein